MIEINTPVKQEITTKMDFIAKQLTPTDPIRCVDGRPDPESPQGPQMLGGILHPLVIHALFNNEPIQKETTAKQLSILDKAGLKIGVHRGSHKQEGASDCGFSDRLPEVLTTAIKQKGEIASRLEKIAEENSSTFEALGFSNFESTIEDAYETIDRYQASSVKIKGEDLVSHAEKLGAQVELVQGDHQEQTAFVNIKKGTTLNTKSLNETGHQAFNLDLLAACELAEKLGVPIEFSAPASLILYMATEMVLVEGKGKPALPIEIHK